eukprot:TRINITY_DN8236_c0_g1_i1.p1 TRINITY_DN8236_c0_g1~~TRINITY_DN8236_c0_g1_i1.p1  ORF type:complete len:136 (+),score=40.39 TRINITY_DN8236_c0_g1_i1:195-602(+)
MIVDSSEEAPIDSTEKEEPTLTDSQIHQESTITVPNLKKDIFRVYQELTVTTIHLLEKFDENNLESYRKNLLLLKECFLMFEENFSQNDSLTEDDVVALNERKAVLKDEIRERDAVIKKMIDKIRILLIITEKLN